MHLRLALNDGSRPGLRSSGQLSYRYGKEPALEQVRLNKESTVSPSRVRGWLNQCTGTRIRVEDQG